MTKPPKSNKAFLISLCAIVLFTLPQDYGRAAGFDLENLRSQTPAFTAAHERISIFDTWNAIASRTPQFTPIAVGIVDSGVNVSHQEFKATTSGASIFGTIDFGNTPSSAKIDTIGHGTAVAGIIGANNLLGEGFPLSIDSPQMNGILSGPAGIEYTLEMRRKSGGPFDIFSVWSSAFRLGARAIPIVNMSTGLPRPSDPLGISRWLALDFAFKSVLDSFRGTLFMVAGGNEEIDVNNVTPARHAGTLSNVIAAGATNHNDDNRRASSNFGTNTTIAAPGNFVYAPTLDNAYDANFSGTSASAPMVTGVAGLLKAINPALTPADLKRILTSTADPIHTTDPQELAKKLGSACDDGSPSFRGCRLNAFKAVCHKDALNCEPTEPSVPIFEEF